MFIPFSFLLLRFVAVFSTIAEKCFFLRSGFSASPDRQHDAACELIATP
jgi:hypothetical protein